MDSDTRSDAFLDELHEQAFYVQRCIRYHMHREDFFGNLNKWNSFLGVVFGSTAIASLLQGCNTLTLASAALVTVSSAMDLVVGTSAKMLLHGDLRKRFLMIEMGLLASDLTSEKLHQAKIECRKIEADEPPGLPFLNEMAANEVIQAIYPAEAAKEYLADLPWHKKVTANLINWDVSPYLKP